MRKIKFRAWDRDNKKMWEHYAHVGKNGTMYVGWANDDKDPQLIVMQWIGILDRKGREIYEGDIVIYGPWGLRTVEAIGPRYALVKKDHPLFPDWRAPAQVVGNIYENPELMSTDK